MKSAVIELRQVAVSEPQGEALTLREKLLAYLELTKPRITFLIVLTAAAGFCLGARDGVHYLTLFHSMFAIALLSYGIATLNQFM